MTGMSTQTLIRTPAGTVAGGEFATHNRTPDDITLEAVRYKRVSSPGDFAVNEAFPLPQADNLDRVLSVIDAVAAGANTGAAIAEALGIHDREGSYYGDAAGYLNLVDESPGVSPKTYQLTPLGEMLLDVEVEDRIGTAAELVRQSPLVDAFTSMGDDGARELLSESNLTSGTIERRLYTAQSWARATEDLDALTVQASETVFDCRARASAAASHAAEIRLAREIAHRAPVVAVCDGCFMQLPSAGVCENC